MKLFQDKPGDVWKRGKCPPNVITNVCWGNIVRIHEGKVECWTPENQWKETTEYKLVDVQSAIKALWPMRTEDQLWKRVARLAGELSFGISGAGIFRMTGWGNAETVVRELIKKAREWASYSKSGAEHRRCRKLLPKLEAALKAWENAK